MSWFKKLLPTKISSKQKKGVPEGLWSKCPACAAFLFKSELEKNLDVCPKCDHHLRINARRRIEIFLDENFQEEIASDITPVDILKFRDTKKYKDRIAAAQKKTGEKDALIVVAGRLNGKPVVVCAFEFGFIGGSMGAVVGEKFVKAADKCLQDRTPLICFATSGGARMQESLISLMQMSKTSAAIAKLGKEGLPYISVLLDPCTGGVSASLAMLGDVNIAEPKALIGFAGPRVIAQTVKENLPEGFQRSEFLLEKGAIDMIVHRRDLKNKISSILSKLTRNR